MQVADQLGSKPGLINHLNGDTKGVALVLADNLTDEIDDFFIAGGVVGVVVLRTLQLNNNSGAFRTVEQILKVSLSVAAFSDIVYSGYALTDKPLVDV